MHQCVDSEPRFRNFDQTGFELILKFGLYSTCINKLDSSSVLQYLFLLNIFN
jgi:hypothetical protein